MLYIFVIYKMFAFNFFFSKNQNILFMNNKFWFVYKATFVNPLFTPSYNIHSFFVISLFLNDNIYIFELICTRTVVAVVSW